MGKTKTIYLRTLILSLLWISVVSAFGTEIEINGINYLLSTDKKEAAVVSKSLDYSGDIVIPQTVTFKENLYKVTEIENNAFAYCSGLTSVTIPNSVISIGDEAFEFCYSLTSITIPNSVTSIGNGAFYGTLWLDNQPDGVVYAGKVLYKYKGTMPEGTKISIKEGTLGIAESAFNERSRLTSVTIPNSVTSIGDNAFFRCSGLTSVTLHCSEIGSWFSGISSIQEIVLGDEVTSIGDNAFYNCSGLTSITIPNSVTSIGDNAFYNCSGLTSITIPNSVTSIGSYSFYNCSGLTSITIPNSVTSIGSYAFYNCSGLTSITIPNSVTSIGSYSFYNCTGLISITIPNSVTSIGSEAFRNCSGLTSVTIPNSVTTIGQYAFYECSGLTSITIPNSVTSIGSEAFRYCNLKTAIIGSGVLSIGYGAFSNPIKTIWLTNTPPSGYTYAIGTVNYVANEQYGFSNQTVYPFLSSMFVVDGVRYVPVIPSERTCDAIDCIYDETAESIHIGQTVTNKGITLTVKQVHPYACYENVFIKDVNLGLGGDIGRSAFSGCSFLQTATLGEEVTSIGQEAFKDCSALQAIVIPNAVQTLGSYAFQGCSSMSSVQMGSGVTSIEQYTFSGCSSLTNMQIGSSVATINNYAFNGCSSLPSVHIPQATTNIKNYVFSGCSSLAEVIMDDSETVLTLGSNGSSPLFSDCPLNNVYIGRNISYKTSSNYGYSPFYRNTSLYSVTITDEETEISENEFYGCTNLKIVHIGDGVQTIGNWAFSGCANLDDFAFGSSLQTIGKEAFSDCTAVTKIYSKASTPPTCGDQALDDINKWTCSLSVPTGKVVDYQVAEQWKEFFYINDNDEEPEDDEGDPITITIKNCSREYGEANPTFEYEVSGDLEGTPSFSCTATAASPVGTYQITGSKGSVTNSNVTFSSGVLTVTKAMLTVTADNCMVTQGGQMPEFTLSYSGFKNDETASVLTTRPTASCVATSESNTGDYEISVSGGAAQNYDFTYVAGTLTIEPTSGRQLYASDVTTYKGKNVTLPISLTNEQTIAGFQFDLKLPTGISVAKSGNNYLASLSSRASGLDLSISKLESGVYRFMAFSNEANFITGNSGGVLTINLDIPSTTTIGENTITIKNVVLTAIVNQTSQSVYADNATSTLTILDFTLGDTNGDNFINVTDVASIVTHVLGQAQTNFTEIAADVNNDGVVDTKDVTAEINTVKANASVGTGVSSGKLLYGNALSVYKGKQIVLPIVLENTQTMAGYQFDLRLPTGVSLATDGAVLTDRATGLALYSSTLGTNQYRFVVVSTSGNTIATGDGAVMNLTLNVTDNAANGENTIAISNVILTAKSGNNVSSIYSDQANITLTVENYSLGDVNGDGYINVTDVVCMVYDILGQTQTGFIRIAADINDDGEVNITDLTAVVSMILSNEGLAATRGATRSSENFTMFDALAMKDDGNGALSLCLEAPARYIASQMEIELAEGQELKNISLNDQYKDSHKLIFAKSGARSYLVLVFSMGNSSYSADRNELLKINISGQDGMIEVNEAVMVTAEKEQHFMKPISHFFTEATDEPVDIYATDGRLVKRQAKDTSGLPKGVYIIKGKKVIVK